MRANDYIATDPISNLRQRWAVFAVLCLVYLGVGYFVLANAWSAIYALRWAFITGLALVYLLSILRYGLAYNHRQGETQLLPTLGWGNRLTLLRGMLIAGVAGFLTSPPPDGWLAWAPGLLYTMAIATDFFDGYLARITNHTTNLGEILDMSFDGLGVFAAVSLAVSYGQLPTWYLLIAIARYVFIAGLWVRKRLRKSNYALPPSISRRALAGFQMGFLAVMLWPVFSPPGAHIVAVLFGVPLLVGFIRDWFHVTGVLKPDPFAPSKLRKFISHWLPLTLRFIVIILGISLLIPRFSNLGQLEPNILALAIADLVVILFLFLGVMSRTVAIAGLLLLGFHQIFVSLSLVQIFMAAVYSGILFLGGGPFSLWAPEEYLVHHRAGKPKEYMMEQSS